MNGLRYQVRRTCNPYSPFALKFNFWRLLLGNPSTIPPAFIDKNFITGYCSNIIYGEKAIPGYSHPIDHCLTISRHLPENSIFCHLPPFAPVYGQPLDPTSTFIDKNVITGCYCNNIYKEKAIPGCFYPIVSPSPPICLKIPFLAIYPHLRLLMGDPLTPPPLLLTKMLILDAIAMIYTERKQFQAFSTPLSCHHLPFA